MSKISASHLFYRMEQIKKHANNLKNGPKYLRGYEHKFLIFEVDEIIKMVECQIKLKKDN